MRFRTLLAAIGLVCGQLAFSAPTLTGQLFVLQSETKQEVLRFISDSNSNLQVHVFELPGGGKFRRKSYSYRQATPLEVVDVQRQNNEYAANDEFFAITSSSGTRFFWTDGRTLIVYPEKHVYRIDVDQTTFPGF